jgi:hypothetical protein
MASLVLSGDTSGTVTLAAPAVAGTQSYTLPTAVPAANGYALTATTAGVMSWASVATSAATPTALGTVYGKYDTTNNQTFVGYSSGSASSTAAHNVAVGSNAMSAITTGTRNVIIGSYAAGALTTGEGNIVLGSYGVGSGLNTFSSNTSGSSNIAIGGIALNNNTTASYNIAIGGNSLPSNTTGSPNLGIGYAALLSNTTGGSNVALGDNSLRSNTTASNNTAVGYQAGYGLTTGSNNTYIGMSATQSGVAVTGEIVLCTASTTGKGSNTGYINTSGGVYQGNNSASWSVTSDQRLKKNIVDNNVGLEAIKSVRVCNFEYRLPEEINPELESHCAIAKDGVQLGVIAQELQAVLPDCVKQESTGVLSVDSDPLTWYMVNAIKQLSTKLDVANTAIQELSAANEALTARIAALEAK